MDLPRITDFEILEKLGAGSYATVYRARHKVYCWIFQNNALIEFSN